MAEPRADASCQGGAAPAAGAQALSARKQRRCYRYGNYRGYYGYRVGAEMEDHRLLSLRREWFEGRRCIDVGCNEGLVSLTLAVRFRTASFLGVDIDGALVHNAHLKLRRLQRAAAEAAAHVGAAPPGERVPEELASLAAAAPALTATQYRRVHELVTLLASRTRPPTTHACLRRRRANFLDLELPPASADTIVCLSVSKWCVAMRTCCAEATHGHGRRPRARVHLNWGDAGLLRLFERCHELLAPGGLLVLEPQPWKSYRQALRKQDVRARRRACRPRSTSNHACTA